MPTVEVIVPAYNAELYLGAAIESVLAQTFDDWRILLVDDGSTDGTAAIAAAYAERLGPKLKYIYQANAGLPAARNTAIRYSQGEFLALLDADDVWCPCRLHETLKVFQRSPRVGLTYGFIEGIDAQGKVFAVWNVPNRNPEGSIASAIYKREIDLPCPSVTFRKAAIDEVGLFDETMRATEDRDLWLRIALRWDVGLVRHVLAQYRSSPNAMTRDPERMFKAQLRFIEKHYGAPGCDAHARRVVLSHIHRQKAEALATGGAEMEAIRFVCKAIAYRPTELRNWRALLSLLGRRASFGHLPHAS